MHTHQPVWLPYLRPDWLGVECSWACAAAQRRATVPADLGARCLTPWRCCAMAAHGSDDDDAWDLDMREVVDDKPKEPPSKRLQKEVRGGAPRRVLCEASRSGHAPPARLARCPA